MKIVELRAESFKRIKAVHIRPGGALQQITGRNAQGKTSVLDAVFAALGGKEAAPGRPIRDGEKRAHVQVDLGDIVVTRRWSANDKSTLVVESKDGASYKSPQAMLDKLIGGLSFDPLAFVRQSPKHQADTLRMVAGLDTTELDSQRRALYERRTEANRALRSEQVRLEAMPLVEAAAEPVSVGALLAELKDAESKGRERETAWQVGVSSAEALAVARGTEADAVAALAAARERLAVVEHRHAVLVKAAEERLAVIDPDPLEIQDRIANAESINEQVRQRQAREKQIAIVKLAATAAGDLDERIETLDAQKAEMLAAAKFPVPGLSVDSEEATYNGVPLSQASGAEQLRVSLAMAAALNPKLRVVLVRDGSLLDKDGLQLVADWAAEHDMQVLLERVADGGKGVGVIIEDGMVQDDRPVVDASMPEEIFPVGGAG